MQPECMLYWAEGSRSRNAVVFTNSDPAMVRFMAAFLQRYYLVPDEAFTVTCNLFADHIERQQQIEQFWLDTLGLPASCLRKSTVNVYSKHSKKKRCNKLRTEQSAFASIQRRSCRASTGRSRSTAGSSGWSGSDDPRK
jgi:hypothetical protein